MVNYLKSEFMKQKHRFTFKLLWIAPLVTIALVIILMAGSYLAEGAFNWWYTMILPGSLSMMIAFTVSAEKKHNRHGLLAISVVKEKLWISQILMNTILLLIINIVFCVLLVVTCAFFGVEVSFMRCLMASTVLYLTFAWQIPMSMFASEKLGSFLSIIISLVFNMGFGIFLAPTKFWSVPFAIPARLMCPIIKVMPNGLPLVTGSHLEDSSVIIIGITIATVLYFICSVITTAWFRHQEER